MEKSNLTSLLLAGSLFFSSNFLSPSLKAESSYENKQESSSSQTESLPKKVFEIYKIILKNKYKEEEEFPTFYFPSNTQEYKEKTHLLSGSGTKLQYGETEVTYKTKLENQVLHLSIETKDWNKHNWQDSDLYLRNTFYFLKHKQINNYTKIIIFSEDKIQPIKIQEQAYSVKQGRKIYLTEGKLKGLIPFEKHKDAQEVIQLGEEIIKETIEEIPNFAEEIQQKYNKFIKYSEETFKKNLEEIAKEYGNNISATIIPLYLPCNLTNQILTKIEYKIEFNQNSENLNLLIITNLGNYSTIMDNNSIEGAIEIIKRIEINQSYKNYFSEEKKDKSISPKKITPKKESSSYSILGKARDLIKRYKSRF
jgi:hypothetical protein